MYSPKYTNEVYLKEQPYGDLLFYEWYVGGSDISNIKQEFVTVSEECQCDSTTPHEIALETPTYKCSFTINSQPHELYMCLECFDKWLDSFKSNNE